jgi:hypothetical protein
MARSWAPSVVRGTKSPLRTPRRLSIVHQPSYPLRIDAVTSGTQRVHQTQAVIQPPARYPHFRNTPFTSGLDTGLPFIAIANPSRFEVRH